MKGQPSSSLSQEQYLETKLTQMLQGVVPEMSEPDEQCIYKVPQIFLQVNPKAFTPRVLSIGPFHRLCDSNGENSTLKPMEELKLKFLQRFLNRNEQLSMKDLFLILIKKEKLIRSCYACPIECSSNDFLMMILVDACFIIEHFLRYYTSLDLIERDPLSKPWLLSDVDHDLTLLENQLPFFVLEDLFNYARPTMNFELASPSIDPIIDVESRSFLGITFHYFNEYNNLNIQPTTFERPKHFTDLLRSFMQPPPIPRENKKSFFRFNLQSASQLSEAGLVFKVSSSKCLFDIKFHHHKGVLEMPCLIINDDTETMFRNILAFEQCHYADAPNVAQYLLILDLLINTDKDVNVLIDKKIIVNWMGDASAVAKMFNSLCSNAIVPFISKEYFCLLDELNDFYENPYNKYKAIFYHEYFNTPWKKASTIAAVLLLCFTLVQTICSIISLF